MMKGFYSSAAALLEVCSGEEGGSLCAHCDVGEVLDEDGECIPCNGVDYVLLVIVGLVAFIFSLTLARASAIEIS